MSGQVCGLFQFTNFHLNIISKHAALLEAMEQQQISVAKAGVVCTLPARTAIIAAAAVQTAVPASFSISTHPPMQWEIGLNDKARGLAAN